MAGNEMVGGMWLLVLLLVGVLIVLWIVLPILVFSIRERLGDLLLQQKRTNELLAAALTRQRGDHPQSGEARRSA